VSETLWGVIIGGGIALIVSVVGYFIQGYFSIKALKIQSELSKTQRYEERLIQQRTKYLEPLRNITIICCKYTQAIMEEITSITATHYAENTPHDQLIARVSDKQKFKNDSNNLAKIALNLDKETRKLFRFPTETSDHYLANSIFDVMGLCSDLGARLLTLLTDYSEKIEQDTTPEINFTSILHDYAGLYAEFHNINFRIEQLMTGIDEPNLEEKQS